MCTLVTVLICLEWNQSQYLQGWYGNQVIIHILCYVGLWHKLYVHQCKGYFSLNAECLHWVWHQLHTFLLHTSRIVLLLYTWVCAGSKQLFCDWGPQQECYTTTDIWAFYGQQWQGVLMVRNAFSVFWLIWMQKIIGPACVVINTLTECPILHINTPLDHEEDCWIHILRVFLFWIHSWSTV
jgi:hypothetical protein